MLKHRVFAIKFGSLYPLYVKKAESKGRTKKELDQVICWLTGYTPAGLRKQVEGENDLETFFDTRVFLDLHVRVKSEWREDEDVLNDLGVK